ncbi:hypothetical protein [Chitinophaga tropicalis]|uniref:Uncharacterized protein n=1 Tax=Chitinophaga tropicalis TaxID=2683588 RepID=A0A7K1U911_9BACT|nr:hypothetical protein [Chitinophaga tropicalis]MVT10843.1 hypothetical protein [Chitinophaga tropicalis]
MRYIFVISVLAGLLFQNFSQSFIMLKYKIDQAYIARVLCENRNKPDMHCNGKCYLRKQLQKDEQQQNNGTTGKEKYEVVYADALQTFNLAPLAPYSFIIAYYQDPELHTPLFSFFHPPQA